MFDDETWGRLRFQKDRNPLKVVVAQVRFPLIHGLAAPATHAAIQRALTDTHPRSLESVQEVTFAVTPQGPTPPQVEQTAIRFGDPSGTGVIAIGPLAASYETTRYESWEAFRPEFERVLRLVAEHGMPTEYARLGLRYVDEVVIEGVATIDDWAEILSPNVLGDPGSLLRDPRVVETSQQGRIRIGEDDVRFRHAYVDRRRGVEDHWSVYVIDTDISTSRIAPWDIAELLGRVDRYHDWMTKIFGRSLTPVGVQRLGGMPR